MKEKETKEDKQFNRFEKFLNLVRGRKDVKSQAEVLANPENKKSMSILSPSQVEFCQDSYWLAKDEECFEPMRDYADEMMEFSPSKMGQGREQTIRFVGALSESKLLKQLGVHIKGEEKGD